MMEIPAVFSSFKAMLDLVKGIKDLNDNANLSAVTVELQAKILAAQEDQFSLVSRVRELEQKLLEFENWNSEKQRYQLTDFGQDTFAYALKPDCAGGEPVHKICANCFESGRKSILQRNGNSFNGQEIYRCPGCSQEVRLGVYLRTTAHRLSRGDW